MLQYLNHCRSSLTTYLIYSIEELQHVLRRRVEGQALHDYGGGRGLYVVGGALRRHGRTRVPVEHGLVVGVGAHGGVGLGYVGQAGGEMALGHEGARGSSCSGCRGGGWYTSSCRDGRQGGGRVLGLHGRVSLRGSVGIHGAIAM